MTPMCSSTFHVLQRFSHSAHAALRCTAIAVLSLFLAQSCFAGSGSDCPDISQQFAVSKVKWDRVQPMVVGGVALCSATFTSSLTVVEVGQRFSKVSGVFERVLSAPNQLVMSGVAKNLHWVAMIRKQRSGTFGYVSTMNTSDGLPTAPYPWLPPQAQLVFFHAEKVNNERTHQQGYQLAWSVEQVRTHITRALSRQGWIRRSGVSDVSGQSFWHRAGEHLSILAFQDTDGSLLLIQHVMQEG